MKSPFDRILGHGNENDGIEEYDNPLPAWWVGLFALTVVWGVAYAVEYHLVSHRSEAATWAAEVAAAKAAMPSAPAAIAEAPTPEMVKAGKAIFDANCVGCHGTDLRGGVGPDLTDAVWIHGGSYAEIRDTINNGVPEKGMITWGPILGPAKVAEVAAFVHAAGGGS
jgi:cytochrome c oxidase cbb3-type subunit 3